MNYDEPKSFRAVLFWTELKQKLGCAIDGISFRAVLFWTELKPPSHLQG